MRKAIELKYPADEALSAARARAARAGRVPEGDRGAGRDASSTTRKAQADLRPSLALRVHRRWASSRRRARRSTPRSPRARLSARADRAGAACRARRTTCRRRSKLVDAALAQTPDDHRGAAAQGRPARSRRTSATRRSRRSSRRSRSRPDSASRALRAGHRLLVAAGQVDKARGPARRDQEDWRRKDPRTLYAEALVAYRARQHARPRATRSSRC